MKRICINLDEKEIKLLEKRGKENLLTLNEMVENIVRRSCVSYSKRKKTISFKCDDRLVGAFSRHKSGRKPKKK